MDINHQNPHKYYIQNHLFFSWFSLSFQRISRVAYQTCDEKYRIKTLRFCTTGLKEYGYEPPKPILFYIQNHLFFSWFSNKTPKNTKTRAPTNATKISHKIIIFSVSGLKEYRHEPPKPIFFYIQKSSFFLMIFSWFPTNF